MSETGLKKDLLDWIHGRFMRVVQDHTRQVSTETFVNLFSSFARFSETDEAAFHNAIYNVFAVKEDESKQIFQQLQNYKKQYKEFMKNGDSFYNSQQCKDELAWFRNTETRNRFGKPLDQLLQNYKKAIHVNLKEPSQYFKHSRSSYFINGNILEIKRINNKQNEVLEKAIKFGTILNAITIQENYLLQFSNFEGMLGLIQFGDLQQEYCGIFYKKEDLDTDKKLEEKKEDLAMVLLKNVPTDLLQDKFFEQPFINKKFLKAVYFQQEKQQVLMQFVSVQSAIKFLKLQGYKDVCQAELIKDQVNMDEYQQIQWKQ